MRPFDTFLVLGDQVAARGPQDPSQPTFTFLEQDSYLLRLNALEKLTDPRAVDRFKPAVFPFVSFEATLGLLDSAPDAGTWTIRLVGSILTPASVASNSSAAQLATALNALADVTAAGGVSVTIGNAGNIYLIRPVVATADLTFEVVSLSLVPLCFSRVRKGTDSRGSFSMVKIYKAPFAYTDDFSFPEPPPVTVVSSRTGSPTQSAVQTLTIPPDSVGSFSLSHAGFDSDLVAVSGSAADFAAALNALFPDGSTNPRFVVTPGAATKFQISCVGPLANVAVPTLGVTMFGQAPLDTPQALLRLNGLPLELSVSGKAGADMVFEIIGIDEDGNESTLLHQTATVLNRLLDPSTVSAIRTISTTTETVYQSTDPDAPVLIGQRSAAVVIAGSGVTTTAGDYEIIFTHNLNTLKPGVECYRMIGLDPEQWERIPDNEYTAKCEGDPNAVKLSFAYTPPTTGHIGAIEVYVTNWDAQLWSNEHTHWLTQILRQSDGVNLADILDELAATLPTGWPNIPANKLTGLISLDNLDITKIAQALRTNSEFLKTLLTLIDNSEIIDKIAQALINSQTFVNTLSAVIVNPAILASLTESFSLDPNFAAMIAKIFGDLLQGIAGAGSKAIPLAFKDLNETFPPTNPDGTFAIVPAAVLEPDDLGAYTGRLPRPDSSNAGKYYTIGAEGAHTAGHAKIFREDDVVFSDGHDWYLAEVDGTKVCAAEFSRTLWKLEVNDSMLSLASLLSLLYSFSLRWDGNCEAYFRLRLIQGIPTAAGDAGTDLEEDAPENTIVTIPLVVTDVGIMHTVGYSLSRSAGNVLAAKKQIYTASPADTTAPGGSNLTLRLVLDRFDVEDVPQPRGQLTLTTPTKQVATITPLP